MSHIHFYSNAFHAHAFVKALSSIHGERDLITAACQHWSVRIVFWRHTIWEMVTRIHKVLMFYREHFNGQQTKETS